MQNSQKSSVRADFITINEVAINRNEISIFYWCEDSLELSIRMKCGDEHTFCFANKNELIKGIWEFE